MENTANTAASNSGSMVTKRSNSMKYTVIGIVILVVLALVLGAMFVLKDKKTGNPTPNTSSQTSSAVAKMKISVLEEGELVLPKGHADPTVVRTATGYRMYVNRQSGGPVGILIFKSADGITWEKESDLIIPGASTSRAVVLPNGVRIYYPQPQPIRPTDPTANMISTFSTDGLTFTKDEGIVVAPQSSAYYVEGPTVFQLADGSWRMYFNENSVAAGMQRDGKIWGATSADGLTWTRDTEVTLEADEVEAAEVNSPWEQVLHPFVLKSPEGGYIMFYNTHSEMFAATSEDGLTWDKIGSIGIHGADIDGYFQEDGTIRVYYGDFNPQDGGLVYMAVLQVE